MIGQGQHRLHHVQIVQARRVRLGERRCKKIGLLLIVALDGNAVTGLDDGLQQRRGAVGRTDFSAAANRASPAQPVAAACRWWSWTLQHCEPFRWFGMPMGPT
jgi:hypothetical protein